MGNGNAPTLQSMCFCEENCRQTYTDWTAVSPETTETGVADLFYTVLFNGNCGCFFYKSVIPLFPEVIGIPMTPEIRTRAGLIWRRGRYISSGMQKFLDYCARNYA